MKLDMIELLRGEFAQEVPATLEMLAQWQDHVAVPPETVFDMISLLDRFGQAVQTVGLDGLSLYLGLIQDSTENLITQCSVSNDSTEDVSSDFTDIGADLELCVFWLSQWVEHVLDYLEKPADPQVVERMVAHLSLNPQPIENETLLSIAEQLLITYVSDNESNDDELDLLEPATEDDVALPTDDVDPDLLNALLSDADHQLELLEHAVRRWGDGECSESEMLEAQRAAHTFKGSGYIIGLPGIGRLAHRLEDVLEYALDCLRSDVPATPAIARDVTQAVYCLQQMMGYLKGEESAPVQARAVLQRMIDWAVWIRHGEAAMAAPEPLAASGDNIIVSSMPASAGVEKSIAAETSSALKTPDAAMLRIGLTQLNRMLRRAGQSIISSERLSKLLLDTDEWLVAMQRNNQVMAARLQELDLMVNSQVSQLRIAQVDGGVFDPLELDRYDALHGLARFIGEAAHDSMELVDQARMSTAISSGILREEGYALVEQHRELLSSRMVAVKTIIPRLKRTVAQTASATERQVHLQIVGEDIALDSDVLGRLTEPLLHLLRNAVDHGIESPEDRAFQGKPEHGTIQLEFKRSGDDVVLCVSDDGRGLDLVAIEEKAIAYGLIPPGTVLSEAELQRLILHSGFSTRETVTETSGRGVGMDIVNDRIKGLKGRLDISSAYGEGSQFTVHVPARSGVAHALVVQASGDFVAIPLEQITTIVAAGLAEFTVEGENVYVTYQEQRLPAFVLGQWLNLEHLSATDVIEMEFEWIPVLVHGAKGPIALLVEAVIESKELILQDVGRLIRQLPGVVGGALRPDGKPLFLIGVSDLEYAVTTSGRLRSTAQLRQRKEVERTHILVVDDAWSVRRAMQQLLEDAGYDVAIAADGFEALDRLRAKVPALVITDLEMPNLNGLDLSRRVREMPQWSDVPVIMITSRTSDKHRDQALKAGVSVYLTKPYQDGELLNHVRVLCKQTLELSIS